MKFQNNNTMRMTATPMLFLVCISLTSVKAVAQEPIDEINDRWLAGYQVAEIENSLDQLGPYSRKRAVYWPVTTTFLAVGASITMAAVGFSRENDVIGTTGLAITGASVGVLPSWGHLYARNYTRSLIMIVVRSTVAISGLVGPSIVSWVNRDAGHDNYAGLIYLLGVSPPLLVLALVLAILDLTTAVQSVDKANAAYRERIGLTALR